MLDCTYDDLFQQDTSTKSTSEVTEEVKSNGQPAATGAEYDNVLFQQDSDNKPGPECSVVSPEIEGSESVANIETKSDSEDNASFDLIENVTQVGGETLTTQKVLGDLKAESVSSESENDESKTEQAENIKNGNVTSAGVVAAVEANDSDSVSSKSSSTEIRRRVDSVSSESSRDSTALSHATDPVADKVCNYFPFIHISNVIASADY